MMIPRYFYLRDEGSIWWAPVVMEIIVAHLVIYVQMFVEFLSWNEKRNKWQRELMFFQQYKQSDVSETQLISQINLLSLNPNAPVEGDDNGPKKSKTLKLNPSYFTCTYFALMKESKEKLKLKGKD
mmetsp:Transcript_4816/g.8261  ORF Transcript_4816/g.8261 Transcript_4816/m.8261 type:complete len:126 (-) Transcript_4816:645-1022(-)